MATAQRAAPPLAQSPFAQRVSLLLLGGVTLIAVTAVGLFQVFQTSRAATMGYGLQALEQERSALAAELRLIEADIARVSRLEQIREQAVERLGMVVPEETLRIAVDVPKPRVIPMPERYVVAAAPVDAPSAAWWERLLRRVPGFD